MEEYYNEYYGTPTTANDDYLAHYGIKGMKWGVRKAIASGNARRLGRQYRKAAKKLAKLEKRASNGKKYARRAIGLGAGAALAGGAAAAGTLGVSKGIGAIGSGIANAGTALGTAAKGVKNSKVRGAMQSAAAGLNYAGLRSIRGANALKNWGGGNSVGRLAKQGANAVVQAAPHNAVAGVNKALTGAGHGSLGSQVNKLGKISNSGYARLAAAGLGAGLAGAAGYNAYRAATTKRAARKAAEFRSEMNKAFAGTKYANGGSRKRRRR